MIRPSRIRDLSGRGVTLLATILIVTTATQGRAQSSLSDVLGFLVTNSSVATGDFVRDRDTAQATSQTIARTLLANIATLPVTTSSGAFTYRLSPELGTVQRSTQSFGPFFVERAITAGRGRSTIGLTFQHLHFTSLDGRQLRDGSLVTTANQFNDESAPFDVDRLSLSMDATVSTLFLNVGITDRLDAGFAAPVVRLSLDGSRVNTYRGRPFTQAVASATTIGLADVLARAKYTLFDEDGAGLALAVDARLPTGRKTDLLGTGTTSLKLAAIGSLERGSLSGHATAGVTVGGLAREVSYGTAMVLAATSHVTVSGELMGRWIEGLGRVISVSAPHPTLVGVSTLRLGADASNVNLMTLVPGFKWNLTSTWVFDSNVAIPLTGSGLTSSITPFVGLDYAFGR